MINTDTQHPLGSEYIKHARDVLQGSNLDNRCVHGTVQVTFSRIKSQAEEEIKAKWTCIRNWKQDGGLDIIIVRGAHGFL